MILATPLAIQVGWFLEPMWTLGIGAVQELDDAMVAKDERGDLFTLHIVMYACMKKGKPEEAREYFRQAKDRGMELDETAYNVAVRARYQELSSELAWELLDEIKEKGLVPSEFTFACVTTACVKQGHIQEALRVKDEMLKRRWSKSSLVFLASSADQAWRAGQWKRGCCSSTIKGRFARLKQNNQGRGRRS